MIKKLLTALRVFILLTVIICFGNIRSYASHIFGIDLYYTYVSGTSYTITLVVYGDCSGSAFPFLSSSTPEVDLYDGNTSSASYFLTVQAPTNGVEVTPVCAADINNTTCTNVSNPVPGVKKFVYSATVNVPYASTTWRFVFSGNMGNSQAGRSNNITNVVIPAAGSLIGLVDTLNNVPGNNSDLVFTIIPTPFFCLNVPANYNPGAVDPNNDSDAFALIPAYDAISGGSVTYIAPYTPTAPLAVSPGTFSFTNATAQLSFTPNFTQKSLVVYNGEKFSNGVLVGTCQREMTFVVLSTCDDNPPQGGISNASAGTVIDSTHFQICQSQGNFTFQINPIDIDNDDITVATAGLPAGSTFNIIGNSTTAPFGTFSWNTTSVTPGNYTFYITYQDNGCPLSSKQTQAYTITVLPDPTISFSLISTATCAKKAVFTVGIGGSIIAWHASVWQGTATVQTFTNVTGTLTDSLAPGTYTIKTFNANNCETDTTITIAPPPTIVPAVSITGPTCPTSTDGSIVLTASGGLPPYRYSVGTGAYTTNNSFTNLSAGTYTLNIVDTNFCIKDTVVTVQSPVSIHAIVTLTKPPCNSFQNGVIVISAFNSVAPYQYALGTGTFGTSDTFSNLYSGSYVFHIQNAVGCIIDTTVTLPDSLKIHAALPITNILCNSASTGSITVNASGAFGPPYTYSINSGPAGATNTFTGLQAGTYTINVLDTNNCYFDTTVTLTQPAPIVATNTITNVSCNAGSNGSVTVNVTGGAPAYSYDVNGGSFGASDIFNGLAAGTYTFQIIDANNCIQPDTATLTQPAAIGIAYSLVSTATCAKKAVFHFTPSGIASPWHINVLLGSATQQTLTGITGLITDSLAPGTYTFSTFNSNNCEIDTTIVIDAPPVTTPSVAITPSCVGGATGIVVVTGAGGLPPFRYSIGTGTYTITDTFTSLAAGTYTVHIIDSNFCIADTNIIVNNADSIYTSVSLTRPPCNAFQDGVIAISAFNSVAPYQYAIGTGTYGTTDTFSNLFSGTYIFHIKDALGCILDTTVVLPDSVRIYATVPITNILCHGDSTGAITINATGAFGPPYTYTINSNPYGADSVFSNLPAGIDTIHVLDPIQCYFDSVITITQPAPLVITPAIINVSCNGSANGSVTLNMTGGAGGYNYTMNGGTATTSNIFSGLDTGTYTFLVTDTNNCIKADTITITQPAPLVITAVVSAQPLCNGSANGYYTLTATGGTTTYTYAYNSSTYGSNDTLNGLAAGGYILHVKDANGCITDTALTMSQPTAIALTSSVTQSTCSTLANGIVTLSDTGGTPGYTYSQGTGAYGGSSTFTPLAAGSYTFHVKDTHSCIKDTVIQISDSLYIHGNFTISPAVCYQQASGVIAVSGAGGANPYTYAIGTGAYSATDTFYNDTAGSYTVYIQDSNGCINDTSVAVAQPTNIIPAVTITSPSCAGYSDGSLSVSAAGGTPAYIFALDTGAYASATAYTGLPAGNDTIFVKDNNGCLHDTIVTITQPTPLLIDSLLLSNVKCYNSNSGWVLVYASGATPPLTYGSAGGTLQSNDTVINLASGAQTIIVKDVNGCTLDTPITLTQPQPLTFGADSIVNPTCAGFTNGSILMVAAGGTPPYLYAMGSGTYSTVDSFENLSEGSYTISVTDSNNCLYDSVVTLIGYPHLEVDNVTIKNPSCYGDNNGMIILSASGGVAPLAFQINNDTTHFSSSSFDSLVSGSYKIVITDTKNCVLDTTLHLTQPDSLALTMTATPNDCIGYDDGGVVTVGVAGGTQPYTYLWSTNPPQTTAALSGMPNGNYMVWTTDAQSCVDSALASVVYADCCKPFVPDAFTPNGDGKNDIFRVRFKGDMSLENFSIYNRFGQKVYETIYIDQGWDGTFNGVPQNMDVYFYYIKAICGNRGDHEVTLHGDVTLIR